MNNKIDFIEVHDTLSTISPTLCLAKWKQVTLHLHNGRTHSCHHPYPHKIPLHELNSSPSALHNTSFKKSQRKEMLDGKRPKECQYCWNVEDLDGFKSKEFFSDRITKSADKWALDSLTEILTAGATGDINPSYVEVNFSNLCNFKCSYCSPVYSSRWTEEIESHGAYPTSWNYNNIEYFKSQKEMPIPHKDNNPYVNAFWEWMPSLIESLRVIRVTGGEPLLNDNTFRVLDFFENTPCPELEFAINTNGSVPDKLFNAFVTKIRQLVIDKKLKGVHVYISLDSVGSQAEYSRFGLDFEQWNCSVARILSDIPNVKLTIMCTTNIFSLPKFSQFIQLVFDLKVKYNENLITLDTAILRYPHHLNVAILTPQYKTWLDASLSFMKENCGVYNGRMVGFYDFEINRLARLIDYMRAGDTSIDTNVARRDFYIFVNEHDARRKTNFLNTFPELLEFYKECEQG